MGQRPLAEPTLSPLTVAFHAEPQRARCPCVRNDFRSSHGLPGLIRRRYSHCAIGFLSLVGPVNSPDVEGAALLSPARRALPPLAFRCLRPSTLSARSSRSHGARRATDPLRRQAAPPRLRARRNGDPRPVSPTLTSETASRRSPTGCMVTYADVPTAESACRMSWHRSGSLSLCMGSGTGGHCRVSSPGRSVVPAVWRCLGRAYRR